MNADPPMSVPPGEEFPYELLLAFRRGELPEPERSRVAASLTEARWQAHWESLRHLDLEWAAALQDADDLARFLAALPLTDFCAAVARSEGAVLLEVFQEKKSTPEGGVPQWEAHVERCVYCRRMQRRAYARQAQAKLGEPLARDWLLEGYYADALQRVTEAIRQNPGKARLVLFWRPRGFVAMLVDGGEEKLTSKSAGTYAGWALAVLAPAARGVVRTRSAAAPPVAEPPAAAVQLTRALGQGRGTLRVELRLADGQLACMAEVDAPQDGGEVVLELTFGGQTLRDAAAGRRLHVEGREPAANCLVRVVVRHGAEVWEDSTLRLES